MGLDRYGVAEPGPVDPKDRRVVVRGWCRPASILLTHDHPDHSGSALELARMWSLPVHVHRDELPLVNGSARDYPLPVLPHEPDPPVGGFMILFAILLAPLHRSLFRSVTGTCVDARGVAARQRK